MNYNYILLEPAQEEYEPSLTWYAVRSEQSAEYFIIALEVAFKLICNNPTLWRNKFKDFYEIGVKKYPFTIVYTIDTTKRQIIIFSIFHHKRNPLKKYKR